MVAGIAFNTGRKALLAALAASHTFRAALTNTLPLITQEGFDPVTLHPPPDAVGDHPDGGYQLSGVTAVVTETFKGALKANRLTFDGAGDGLGPFHYMVIYIATMPGNPMVDLIDFGEEITIDPGDDMTFDFSGQNPGTVIDYQ